MATRQPDEPIVQLATRVPESLLQRVRIYCVEREVSVRAFVAEALREKLTARRHTPRLKRPSRRRTA